VSAGGRETTRPWEADLVVARPGGRAPLVVPATALRWRFSRAGGPGGQGVNTTDSRVELSLDVNGLDGPDRERLADRLGSRLHDGVLTVVAADDRSQLRNRQAARERLAAVLRDGLAPDPPPRRARTPSRRARARRVESKRRRGDVKRTRRRPESE
jgi:ribosome-associated protein